MPYNLKTLLLITLSSAFIVSCSNEAAQIDSSVSKVEEPSEILNKVVSEADKQAQAAKEKAMAAAEAKTVAVKEAALKTEAEAKLAEAKLKAENIAKEAEQRAQAEARAIAAKKAAKEQAAKEQATKEAALAEADAKRLVAEQERAKALETQRLEAQRLEAQRLEAERLEAERLEAQKLENQRIEEAQAAAASQVDNTAVVNFQTPALQAGPNAEYNTFLSKYVSAVNGINLVAYDKVTTEDRAILRSYIEKLSAMNIEALPRDAEMATWFNLYLSLIHI